MGSALVGLVGVLIGGLLSGGIAYGMATRDDRNRTRTAARLVRGELLEIGTRIYSLMSLADAEIKKAPVGSPEWTEAWLRQTEELVAHGTPMWTEHCSQLAKSLPDKDWIVVSGLYGSDLPHARDKAIRMASLIRRSESRVEPADVPKFRGVSVEIALAQNALASFAYKKPELDPTHDQLSTPSSGASSGWKTSPKL